MTPTTKSSDRGFKGFISNWVRPVWFAIAVSVLSLAVTFGVRGAEVQAQSKEVKELQTRVTELEHTTVTPREYEQLVKQLDRIETKLDAHVASFAQMQQPKPHQHTHPSK